MFRIRFEAKPDEVAAVKSAVKAATNATVEVSKNAGVAVGSYSVKGLKASRDWLHRITAP